MSGKDRVTSDGQSKNLITGVVKTTNKMGITKIKINDKNISKFNHPVRKMAHLTEYLILSLLVINALTKSGLKGYKMLLLSLIICFIYSLSDEYHQTFVSGRGGMISDSIIDTTGGLIGITGYLIVNKFKHKKTSN